MDSTGPCCSVCLSAMLSHATIENLVQFLISPLPVPGRPHTVERWAGNMMSLKDGEGSASWLLTKQQSLMHFYYCWNQRGRCPCCGALLLQRLSPKSRKHINRISKDLWKQARQASASMKSALYQRPGTGSHAE